MATKHAGRKYAGLVHLDATTLNQLMGQPVAVTNDAIKYVRLTVPTGSEAEQKVRSNFGYLAEQISTHNQHTQFLFPCVYRNLAMDIDFFASVTTNYPWGNDVVFGLKKGGAL
ncbi:MAG: hypothetical protein MJZ75_06480 [Paludibacteraceae bacterium]|nr:hypothetical protein [Paludibacteraceae bacterium]